MFATRPLEKVGLFFDGSNVTATLKALAMRVDFGRLISYFASRESNIVGAHYFTALVELENGELQNKRFFDHLAHKGFIMHTKVAKQIPGRRPKGNCDLDMSVLFHRMLPVLDHFVLFTGDGDFRCWVEELQMCGKKVTVVSTMETRPPMCDNALRKQANSFVDLNSIREFIEVDD